MRRAIVQRLMRPLVIVERQPPADAPARLGHRTIRLDEYLLVFKASPQPLDEDVVQIPPLAIHADPNPASLQFSQKVRTGELSPLVGVEDLRLAVPFQRLLQRFDAEARRSEEHTSELQSLRHLVCRLLLDTATTEIYTLSLHDALPI